MPQSHARVIIHLIFSTKNRAKFLTTEKRSSMFLYLGGAIKSVGCDPLCIGGIDDHVHSMFSLGRTVALCKVVEEMKKESSKWAKQTINPDFYWQNGYGAFSVDPENLDQITQYIKNQEIHHTEMTFQEEYRDFLRRYQIAWDERYVWD